MGTFNPPVPEFLSTSEKEQLVAKKTPFSIMGVNTGPGKYGISHTYELRFVNTGTGSKAGTGEVSTKYISFSTNPRRAIEADYVLSELSNNPNGIGPVMLGAVETDKGNDAWVFYSVD